MEVSGRLLKMKGSSDNVVQYHFVIGEHRIPFNENLGKEITLEFNGEINCIICGRKTSKSFFQGMCYPCFKNAPQAEDCVLRPELCKAHEGVARDMDYAKENCLMEHFVYLADTGDIKVGVTRKSQIPTRWIDQGAVRAVQVAKTPNRYLAGMIEVDLKNKLSDKTNWRKMLSEQIENNRISEVRSEIVQYLAKDYCQYTMEVATIESFHYPVLQYPSKIKSISFDKTPLINGVLSGIKGQYLIFDNGNVLNIRKHGGYGVTLRI